MKNKVNIQVDLQPVKDHADAYLKKKVRAALKEEIDDVIMTADFPNLNFPDIEGRLEKLEDWKRDIEKGWIDLGQYCSKCKKKKI